MHDGHGVGVQQVSQPQHRAVVKGSVEEEAAQGQGQEDEKVEVEVEAV